MRMNITDRVHSFYAADSGEPRALRTLLFLDFDPVLPGWPPDDVEAERGREAQGASGDGVFDTSNSGVRQAFQSARLAAAEGV